jgi:tetratricopeptide (TPR) repeat protein
MTTPETPDPLGLPSRKKRLGVIRMRLRSPKPGDVLLGMNEVEKCLREDSEDLEIYGLLLDAVKETTELRGQARTLLFDMMQKGSVAAQKALLLVPGSVQDLLADADDAYYAAEYDQAIQLYRQVLRLDSENERAKEYLAKSKAEQSNTGDLRAELPRKAVQFFRRARSFIAARDYEYAITALSVAVDTAQAKGVSYPDAESLLNSIQDLQVADEFRQKANFALKNKKWKEALDLYDKALLLDPTNIAMKMELDSLKSLLNFESELQKKGFLRIFVQTRKLQIVFDTAKGVMNPDSPMLVFVQKQLQQITQMRIVGGIILLLLVGLVCFASLGEKFELPWADITKPASTSEPTIALTEMPAQLMDSTLTSTYTAIPSVTPTKTLRPTSTPTPTPVPLAYGELVSSYFKPYDEPNKNLLDIVLNRNQTLIILNKKEDHGALWYECVWEVDGITGRGWILAEKIRIVQAPSSTP